MKEQIGLINRLISVITYGYALYTSMLFTLPKHGLPAHYSMFAGTRMGLKTFLFLTMWNVTFNLLFYSLSLLCHFFPRLKSRRDPHFRDILYHSIVVPLSMVVSIFFWSIYYYDSNLIWPEFFRRAVPFWFNHAVHTLIMVTAVIEGYCYYHRFPKQGSTGHKWLLGVLVTYGLMLLYLGFMHNIWLYPVFLVMPTFRKILFVVSVITAAIIIYEFGEKLHQKLWKHQNRRVSFTPAPGWKY